MPIVQDEAGGANDLNFHDRVIRGLAVLEIQSAAIIERLDRVNGNVANLYERTDSLRDELSDHSVECTAKQEIREMGKGFHELERREAEREGRAKASRTWWTEVRPALWAILGGLMALFLYHAEVLLGRLK